MQSTNGGDGKYKGIQNGWFTETASMWPGQRFSLALKNFSEESVIYHQQSEYQNILVFQSAQYGKVFCIDGILQLTERDEFAFHEMMAHLPLFSHPDPKRVLIVGGGDGACLREVCRHKQVKHVTLVEIDPMVIQASREHLKLVPPELFDQDPRVEIVLDDAAEYLKDPSNLSKYDVILADTLDPIGPAESLFEPEFYENIYSALRPGGIACMQGETFFIHLNLIRDLLGFCKDIFDFAEYATTMAPSYPCGQIGFILARKGARKSCRMPIRQCEFQSDLKWYNKSMHQAAFVLPQYIRKELSALDNLDDPTIRYDDVVLEDVDDCFLSKCVIQ